MSTRPTTRQSSRATGTTQDSSVQRDDKENVKMSGSAGKAKATKKSTKTYCLCQKPDDGSPMIHCSTCKDWYHFQCVQLSERDAADIRLYICSSCQEKTGARIIREWEGPDTIQVGEDADAARASSSSAMLEGKQPRALAGSNAEPNMDEQLDSGLSSDGSDEYHPGAEKVPKRRVRRQSYHSDNDSDSDGSRGQSPKRLRRGNAVSPQTRQPAEKQLSPAASSQAKRKKATSAHPPPPPKRPRSESTAGEDAARKYCLTKLQELFCQIFTRYPFLHLATEAAEAGDARPLTPDKKAEEELTSDEREQLEARAKQFGIDLEQCMYELYSEPDKQGKPVVAGKYKERFRMLTFNLSKADRVVLHMRIASSHISPKELSTMSSTDLASEEEKQSIKKLEEEALAHSILKKSLVPHAKITHKGLQDIEDVTGTARRDVEREREEEEQERIERERLARLRLQTQRAQSQGSVPPESPVVAQTPTWGAPPPVPLHAVQTVDPSSSSAVSRPPLFMPSSSDSFLGSMDIELNLNDLINIDEEPSGEVAMTPVDAIPTPFGENPPLLLEKSAARAPQYSPSPITPTHAAGISPFAANVASRSSFDLNALWTPSESDNRPSQPKEQTDAQESSEPATEEQPMETDLPGANAGDQDFDMFLNNNDNDQEVAVEKAPTPEPVEMSPEEKRAAFDAQPPVWNGTLSMPLDSAIPQEVAVVARQLGGRTLGSDSPLWQTLFPSKELRIDGRVPVEKSAHYLTQVRLNPSKELIAVAFSSTAAFEPAGFHALKNHLLAKGRHGLVFPWGHNPKASVPGRELYIVPLLSSEATPEYMELLDELQLPPQRTVDYLVGVWVLTKGKLAPPPQPAPAPAPALAPAPAPFTVPAPPAAAPPPLPNIDFAQISQVQHLISQSHSPPRALLRLHSPVGGAAPTLPIPNPAPAPNVTTEIASLTPEQIQLMLQTLTKTTQAQAAPAAQAPIPGVSIPPYAVPPSQHHPLAPPSQPIALPSAALQAWASHSEQYPAVYPQQPPHPPPYSPGSHSPPRASYNDGGYNNNSSSNRDSRPYNNYNSNSGYDYDRGYRGRGGRGRGNGDRGRGPNWQKSSQSRARGGPPTGPRNRGNGGGWVADQQQRWN